MIKTIDNKQINAVSGGFEKNDCIGQYADNAYELVSKKISDPVHCTFIVCAKNKYVRWVLLVGNLYTMQGNCDETNIQKAIHAFSKNDGHRIVKYPQDPKSKNRYYLSNVNSK